MQCKGCLNKKENLRGHRTRATLNPEAGRHTRKAQDELGHQLAVSLSARPDKPRWTYGYKSRHHGGMVFGRTSFHPKGIWRWREPLAYRITSRRSASSSQDLHWSSQSMLLKSSIKEPHALIGSNRLQLIIDKVNKYQAPMSLNRSSTFPKSWWLSLEGISYTYDPKADAKYC